MKFSQIFLAPRIFAEQFLRGVRVAVAAFAFLVPNFLSAATGYPFLTLTTPTLTNGQIQFFFNFSYDTPFVIQSSTDLVNWTPVATNDGSSLTVTLDATNDLGFYRAMIPPLPILAYAVAAVGNINFNGSGNTTDSFNSADPQFSTNGQYDSTKANTNGHIASVEGIVSIGLHTIGGNLYLAPSAVYWSSNSQILGAIYKNQYLGFPDIALPQGPAPVAPIVNGTNVLTVSGDYIIYNSLNIDVAAGISVTLRAVTGNFYSGIQIHGGTTNSGTVHLYLCGTNATLAGNAANDASSQAKNLFVFGMPTLTSFALSGTSPLHFAGVIYAPEASLNFSGPSGNIIGSCIGRNVTMNGHIQFHFDEDLLNISQFP